MQSTNTILEELTGKSRLNFHLINHNYNPEKNKKSRKVQIAKDTSWNNLLGKVWAGLNYREAYFDRRGMDNFIRIDIDYKLTGHELKSLFETLGTSPQLIFETQKGWHLFFLFTSSIPNINTSTLAIKLNSLLGGDASALSAPFLRVPGSSSYKNNGVEFKCRVIQWTPVRYDVEEFSKLIGVNIVDDIEAAFCGIEGSNTKYPSKDIETPSKVVSGPRKSVGGYSKESQEDYDERGITLKAARRNRSLLQSYTGIRGDSGCCPYHKEKNPSAGIFLDKKTGYYVFRCFSRKCAVKGNIVQLVSKREGLKGKELINRILGLVGSDLIEDKFSDSKCFIAHSPSKNFSSLITLNLHLIVSPYLDKTLTKALDSFLDYLNQNRNVITQSGGITFLSQKYFAQISGLKPSDCSIALNYFCYMGIIDKLSFKQVPHSFYQKAVAGDSVNFFRLSTTITPEILQTRLEALKQAKINRKNWSMSKLEERLDASEAMRVYPDYYDYAQTQIGKERDEFYHIEPVKSALEVEKEFFEGLGLDWPGPNDSQWVSSEELQIRINAGNGPRIGALPIRLGITKCESKSVSDEDFTCAGKNVCAEMTSCAEAKFYLNQCGVTTMDGDSDGIPCEVEHCR